MPKMRKQQKNKSPHELDELIYANVEFLIT
ncbi:MAG: hypothetical protein ACI86M_002698 [Saprospiraceae bacterium]